MKLSVAMITYNHGRFIGQAIESILAQNVNFEYEIVIGEDCSTDDTRAVVKEFHRRYPDRIKPILRERNVGVMRNFAAVIEACRGEYVAFLEGDDYWITTDRLQRQVNFLDDHPDYAICCGRSKALYEAGTQHFEGSWDVVPHHPAGAYAVEDILRESFVAIRTALLRREFIPVFPQWFLDMKLGDWPLCAMVARRGKVELMDEVVAAYRIHAGSTWSSLSHITRLNEAARMLRALDKEFGYQYSDVIRDAIAAPYLDLAVRTRSEGRRSETAKHLVTYIRNGGWRRPRSARAVAGLITYGIVGSWYKAFSRAKPADQS
jgi:glycosyltransferase involved in cell wall biosynthesis